MSCCDHVHSVVQALRARANEPEQNEVRLDLSLLYLKSALEEFRL